MTRYRIPRRNGLGEDILDTGPMLVAIETLQQQVAELQEDGEGGGASAKAASESVTDHVLEPNPHPQYLLIASFTWSNLGSKPTTLAGFGITDAAAASHTHAIADVTGLQTALDGKAAAPHTHAIANVTGLQTALDGKAATSHTHAISDVTGLQTALDAKLASSAFTWANIGGKPTSPHDAGFTSGRLDTFYDSRGAVSGYQMFDRTNTTRSWVLYANAAVFYLYSGQLAANVVSVSESAGSLSLLLGGSEFMRAAANSATSTRQPRIFVGGSDPGAAAADGDLWIT